MTSAQWPERPWTLVVALAWGLAEATVFFIVPDVFLTLLACVALRSAWKASLFALAGALVGGTIMFLAGTRELIEYVPGIHRSLVTSVESQLHQYGLGAILLGPLRGTPYKIYAVEWAAQHGSLPGFLLISVPARWLRFSLSIVVTHGVAKLLARWTHRDLRYELIALALFWVGFYAFYFARFGW